MRIFCQKAQKNIKTLKKSTKPVRIEHFVNAKLYYMHPEYLGYDDKIPPQHRVSDPLNSDVILLAAVTTTAIKAVAVSIITVLAAETVSITFIKRSLQF